MTYHQARLLQLKEQIRSLEQEAISPDCTPARKEDLIGRLKPLYQAIFAIHEELEVG